MPNSATAKTASGLRKSLKKIAGHSQVFLLVGVVLLVVGLGALSHSNTHPCGQWYEKQVTIQVGKQSLTAQKAVTDSQREDGLSGKTCIGENQAMLFIFDKPGIYSFWMKEMHFPIDMVWLDSSKRVVYIKPNVSPSTYPKAFSSTSPAQYVLELRANRSKSLGLTTGSQVTF